jgi:hypothetical protein
MAFLRELPAALILPLNVIFSPFIFNFGKICIKKFSIKYLIKRNIDRVFQKLIRCIIAFNQLINNFGSLKVKLKWIMCKASSKKNL